MEFMTVKEAAIKWGVSERSVQSLCTAGRVPGAAKFGGTWAIPQDAQKPQDPRRASPDAPAKPRARKIRVQETPAPSTGPCP